MKMMHFQVVKFSGKMTKIQLSCLCCYCLDRFEGKSMTTKPNLVKAPVLLLLCLPRRSELALPLLSPE